MIYVNSELKKSVYEMLKKHLNISMKKHEMKNPHTTMLKINTCRPKREFSFA